MAGSLFERLTGSRKEAETPETEEDESIRAHILRMMTARRGSVAALPDYGLPDLNDLNFSRSELLAECCRAISENISLYEPRLARATVEPLTEREDPLALSFAINAFKVGDDGRLSPWRWAMSLAI